MDTKIRYPPIFSESLKLLRKASAEEWQVDLMGSRSERVAFGDFWAFWVRRFEGLVLCFFFFLEVGGRV